MQKIKLKYATITLYSMYRMDRTKLAFLANLSILKKLQSEKPIIALIVLKKFLIRKIAETIEKSLISVCDYKRL